MGGYGYQSNGPNIERRKSGLQIVHGEMEGLTDILSCAENGIDLIEALQEAITDQSISGQRLREINEGLAELDRVIEELGFHYAPMGALAKMFIFAKENLKGSDALDLASQMGGIYQDLARRCRKLGTYYADI